MHPLVRRYRWIGLFFLSYLLFFAVWATRASNTEFVLYLVIEVILAAAVLVIDLRTTAPNAPTSIGSPSSVPVPCASI